jgi:hypothetical protein
MHPDETRVERDNLRQALVEGQKAQDAATTDHEREHHGRRMTALMQRYRLLGGELSALPGHENRRWK